MCLYPKFIDNPKYKATKKNGGNIPAVQDQRVKKVPIGCQQCIECRKQKARSWQTRLLEDLRHQKNAKFVTLTFNQQSLEKLNNITDEKIQGYERDNAIATQAVRYFLERWRKQFGKSLRHFLITELGHKNTERIHLHGIIWTDQDNKTIQNRWQYGHIYIGTFVSEKTINYISKYIHKQDLTHKLYKSIILTSPGIGAGYMKRTDVKKNQFNEEKTNETYQTRTGHKINLPIYYRNKIYSETQREKLWLYKLDKNERWVCGEKVDITNDETQYYKLLEYYRRKNTQLGYGNDQITWDQKQYEEHRRQLKHEQQKQKTYNNNKNPKNKALGFAQCQR